MNEMAGADMLRPRIAGSDEKKRRSLIARSLAANRDWDIGFGGGASRGLDKSENGRVRRIGEAAKTWIASLRGECVLREVVRADREESGDPRELLRCDRRGRNLDHNADRHRPGGCDHVALERRMGACERSASRLHLGRLGDHRKHDAHIMARACAKYSAKLRLENRRLAHG